MGLPVIDWSVSVGNLLQMLVIVVGGLSVFFTLRADVRVMRHDMGNLKERQDSLNEAFKQLGTILTQVALQDQRLVQMESRITELSHGDGYVRVQEPHRR